jgi:hypothetical protein
MMVNSFDENEDILIAYAVRCVRPNGLCFHVGMQVPDALSSFLTMA